MIGMVVVGPPRSGAVLADHQDRAAEAGAIVELGQFCAHYRGSDTAALQRGPRPIRPGPDRCLG